MASEATAIMEMTAVKNDHQGTAEPTAEPTAAETGGAGGNHNHGGEDHAHTKDSGETRDDGDGGDGPSEPSDPSSGSSSSSSSSDESNRDISKSLKQLAKAMSNSKRARERGRRSKVASPTHS